jgi:hypothetical protein
LNTVDDDMDGQTDCDDSDCSDAGYSCFPGAPEGWFGPIVLYKGALGDDPPCPGEYPDFFAAGSYGIMWAKANCTACSCSNVNLSCNYSAFEGYSDVECITPGIFSAEPPMHNTCKPAQIQGLQAFSAKSPTVSVTGCQPSGGAVMRPPITWEGSARICGGGAAGKCAAGTCRPPIAAPFGGTLCIYKDSFGTCPAPFTVETEIKNPDDVIDTRGCTACTCTSPNDFSCSVTFDLYSTADCSDPAPAFSFDADDGCYDEMNGVAASGFETTVGYSGTCSSAGGVANGGVGAPDDVTVCCMP